MIEPFYLRLASLNLLLPIQPSTNFERFFLREYGEAFSHTNTNPCHQRKRFVSRYWLLLCFHHFCCCDNSSRQICLAVQSNNIRCKSGSTYLLVFLRTL